MTTCPAACLLLLNAAIVSCGTALERSDNTMSTTAPKGIEGAWMSTTLQQEFGIPCPWIIEFFADGSVETNYLNDDGGSMCFFARIPFAHEPNKDPPQIHIGGQLNHCLYRFQDERLQLICDDHTVVQEDQARWNDFSRLKIDPGRRLSDLRGSWLPPLFWGGNKRMVIGANGGFSLGDDSGSIEIAGEGRLLLRGIGPKQKCLFRVTEHRLTLRCLPDPTEWPKVFFDPDVDPSSLETMVLYRLPD